MGMGMARARNRGDEGKGWNEKSVERAGLGTGEEGDKGTSQGLKQERAEVGGAEKIEEVGEGEEEEEEE
jgi:hypothetical protein